MPTVLYLRHLEALGACHNERLRFATMWPAGAEVTLANIAEAERRGFNVAWLVEKEGRYSEYCARNVPGRYQVALEVVTGLIERLDNVERRLDTPLRVPTPTPTSHLFGQADGPPTPAPPLVYGGDWWRITYTAAGRAAGLPPSQALVRADTPEAALQKLRHWLHAVAVNVHSFERTEIASVVVN
jgi:hypothetical protein